MRRKFFVGILSALLALGAAAAAGESPREFRGEIASVDRSSKAIVVKGGQPQRRLKFFLARGGQVTSGGTTTPFAELKRGEQVEVGYTKARSHLWAHTIAVVSGGDSAAGALD